jgi:hypothetical protein
MRELIYALVGLAGSAMLTAGAVLLPVTVFWRWVLVISAVIFAVCTAWLLVDILDERGLGMWVGLNQPLWVRGVIGAVFGAAIWMGVTTMHSKAQTPGTGAAMTIDNQGGGVGAEVNVTGRAGQPPTVGLDIATPGGTGLVANQNGPGTGLKITVGGDGPAIGARVTVGAPPKP